MGIVQYITSRPQTKGELRAWLRKVFLSLAEMEYCVSASDWHRMKGLLDGKGAWDTKADLQFQRLESLSGQIYEGTMLSDGGKADSCGSNNAQQVPQSNFICLSDTESDAESDARVVICKCHDA